MRAAHSDKTSLLSDSETGDKERRQPANGQENDDDDDDDEQIIYSAANSSHINDKFQNIDLNENDKIRIRNFVTSPGGESSTASDRNFVSYYKKNRLMRGDTGEYGISRHYKYFLLMLAFLLNVNVFISFLRISKFNLSFCLKGAAFCLLIYSRQYFIDMLHLDLASTTNLVTFGLFSVLLGVLIMYLVLLKYDVFYIMSLNSLASSICLVIMPLVKSYSWLLFLIFIFGICFGFTKTVAYKWCLKKSRKLNNIRINFLYISIFVGMLICYTIIFMYLKQQPPVDPLSRNSSYQPDLRRNNGAFSLFSTSFTEAPTTTSTPTTTTTTTTPKTHKPKPEMADGDQLQQYHITKPPVRPQPPPDNQPNMNQLIMSCLQTLNRTCSFRINSCVANGIQPQLNSTNTTSQPVVNFDFDCSFKYVYLYDKSLNSSRRSITVDGLANNTKCIEFSKEESTILSCLNRPSDTQMSQVFNQTCPLSNNYTCLWNMNCGYDNATSWDYCVKQLFTTTTIAPTTVTTTTLPTTTTTTTTTTTSTSTTTTTEATTTLSQQANSGSYIKDLVDLTTKNILNFYSKISNNELEFFYLVLAGLNLLLATLYSLVWLKYIVKLVEWVFGTVCYIFLRCIKGRVRRGEEIRFKSMNVSFKKLNNLNENGAHDDEQESSDEEEDGTTDRIQLSGNIIKETILGSEIMDESHFKYNLRETDEDSEESVALSIDDDHDQHFMINENSRRTESSHRALWKQMGTSYLLFMNIGGLFINFFLYMNNYLVSRLSSEYFYQVELINRLFYVSLILSHLFSLAYSKIIRKMRKGTKQKRTNSTENGHNKLSRMIRFILVNKRHLLLLTNILLLFMVSLLQLSSSHFLVNDIKLLLSTWGYSKQFEAPAASNMTTQAVTSPTRKRPLPVNLSDNTVIIYGVIYPLLAGSLWPLLIELLDENKILFKRFIKSRSNFLMVLWFCLILGTVLQSITSNFLVANLFETQNFFVYSNIMSSFGFVLLVFLYFLFLK